MAPRVVLSEGALVNVQVRADLQQLEHNESGRCCSGYARLPRCAIIYQKVQFFYESIPAGDRFVVIAVRGMAVKVKERGGV